MLLLSRGQEGAVTDASLLALEEAPTRGQSVYRPLWAGDGYVTPDVCETGSAPATLCNPRAPCRPPLPFPLPNLAPLAQGSREQLRSSSQLHGSFGCPHPKSQKEPPSCPGGEKTHFADWRGLRRSFYVGAPIPAQPPHHSETTIGLLPPLPSLPPSPLQSRWNQPTLCHLRTPRDSRNGLNSVGRSPGILHEVTSRPLSGLPALPSAGLLSACQTGSSVGHMSLGQDGGIPGHSLPCPFCHLKSPGFPSLPSWNRPGEKLANPSPHWV